MKQVLLLRVNLIDQIDILEDNLRLIDKIFSNFRETISQEKNKHLNITISKDRNCNVYMSIILNDKMDSFFAIGTDTLRKLRHGLI